MKNVKLASSEEMRLSSTFFGEALSSASKSSSAECLVVTHLLPDRPQFLEVINSFFPIRAVIPKRNSIDKSTLGIVERQYQVLHLDREEIGANTQIFRSIEESEHEKFVLFDIGGYFAPHMKTLLWRHPNKHFIVIEDTANGDSRYRALNQPITFQFYSAAKSELKRSEDWLVGRTIASSIDAAIMQESFSPAHLNAMLIGFGRIGASVAQALSRNLIEVTVYDRSSTVLTNALSHGYKVSLDRQHDLKKSNLVICATGNGALTESDLDLLKEDCMVATVTSSDDEFRFSEETLGRLMASPPYGNCTLMHNGKRIIFLNGGRPMNFLNGASVGVFIRLVQAEMLFAAIKSVNQAYLPGEFSLDPRELEHIARKWLSTFSPHR